MRLFSHSFGFLFLLNLIACSAPDTASVSNNAPVTHTNYILNDYQIKWTANKQYTLEVLEAMPEEDFDFQPAEDMRTFREQAEHVGVWLNNHVQQAGHEGLSKLDTSSKEKIIESYGLIFDELIQFIGQLDPEKLGETTSMWYGESTKIRLLNLMDNHLAHHRGQMVVYLRLKGIKPPSYVGW